jgi:hypothetical protein
MALSYAELLARRRRKADSNGREVTDDDIHPSLFPHQKDIVRWAVKGQRRAIWADTGLGKTRMQLEWARLSADYSLIVAPLAVCSQTVREAAELDIDATFTTDPLDVDQPGVYVTNYEQVEKFDPSLFGAVVLDESSILKASDGKTRTMLINHFQSVPNRLACTATPGPNDPEELTNHAEFLGQMTRANMLAAYFVNDERAWRLKGHARGPMVDWMNTWAVAVRKPSDLGYDDTGYDLPDPQIIPQIVESEITPAEGELFAASIGGVSGRSRVRKETLQDRVKRAVELVEAEPHEPWLLWCGLNDEADALAKAIPGSVNVHGSMSAEEKADALNAFSDGRIQVLITKPQIASFGMNWQHCARMAFVGLSDSFEAYYQCIRRCHRFGQKREVHAHIVVSALEQSIAQNVARKQEQANELIDDMINHRKELIAA